MRHAKHMSSAEYVSGGASQCPACRSSNIEGGGNRNADGNWVSMDVSCLDCGATWDDVFVLTEYVNLVTS